VAAAEAEREVEVAEKAVVAGNLVVVVHQALDWAEESREASCLGTGWEMRAGLDLPRSLDLLLVQMRGQKKRHIHLVCYMKLIYKLTPLEVFLSFFQFLLDTIYLLG